MPSALRERAQLRRIAGRAPVAAGQQQLRRLPDARERFDQHVEPLPLDQLSEEHDAHQAVTPRRQRSFRLHRLAHPIGAEQIAGDDHPIAELRGKK